MRHSVVGWRAQRLMLKARFQGAQAPSSSGEAPADAKTQHWRRFTETCPRSRRKPPTARKNRWLIVSKEQAGIVVRMADAQGLPLLIPKRFAS